MNHYKLREGESIRKPVVKRDRIEIRIPVLLICLAMACLIWLYVVSFSKMDPEAPLEGPKETEPGNVETGTASSDRSAVDQLFFTVGRFDGMAK